MRGTIVLAVLAAGGAAALLALPPPEGSGDHGVKIETRQLMNQETYRLAKAGGAELYGELCATCHGADGTGSAAARKVYGDSLPDLTTLSARDAAGEYPEAHVAYVLRHPVPEGHLAEGVVAMPNWAEIFRGTGRDRMVEVSALKKLNAHVATLQK